MYLHVYSEITIHFSNERSWNSVTAAHRSGKTAAGCLMVDNPTDCPQKSGIKLTDYIIIHGIFHLNIPIPKNRFTHCLRDYIINIRTASNQL
jgi:hypothetical protein